MSYLHENCSSKTYKEMAAELGRSKKAVSLKCLRLGISHLVPDEQLWSEEERQYLIDNYLNMSLKELSIELGRSEKGIQYKASQLGIKKINSWSNEELNFLYDNHKETTQQEIADILGRTRSSVNNKATKEKLIKTDFWDIEEIEYVINNYNGKNKKEVADALERSIPSISGIIKKYDLSFSTPEYWTEGDTNYAITNRPIMSIREIAQILGKTEISVKKKLYAKGVIIRDVKEWSQEDESYLIENLNLLSDEELAVELERSLYSLRGKLARMNLTRDNPELIACDGITKCNSLEEKAVFNIIYNDLLSEGLHEHFKKNDEIYLNPQHNENYIPDFLIVLNKTKVIIEYFGLYEPSRMQYPIIADYVEKTHRKIPFFNSLDNVIFVPLFREDIKDKMKNISIKVREAISRCIH